MNEVEIIDQEAKREYKEMIKCGKIIPGSFCFLVGIKGCNNNSSEKRWCSKPCDIFYDKLFKEEVKNSM